ncbi:MAG TPA: hypothetical protein VJZ91_00900 [Blastocatellia bacterium]|nr:hypothetical protein [Blastocatellia bacterium]
MIGQKIIEACIERGGKLKRLAIRYQHADGSDQSDAEAALRSALPPDLGLRVRLADAGRRGGQHRSQGKAEASARNGRLGGRPLTISKEARGKRLLKRRRGESSR